MKTYLKELRGQVRGNARLRRRLDASKHEIARMKRHIAALVTLADKAGYGDTLPVVRAAAAIGWARADEETMRLYREAMR